MNETCDNQSPPPTLLGWIIRIVSLALIFLLAAFLTTQILAPTKDVALNVQVIRSEARIAANQTLIPVKVTNEGSQAIANMQLVLLAGTQEREVEISLLGMDETVVFNIDFPNTEAGLTYKILSYENP